MGDDVLVPPKARSTIETSGEYARGDFTSSRIGDSELAKTYFHVRRRDEETDTESFSPSSPRFAGRSHRLKASSRKSGRSSRGRDRVMEKPRSERSSYSGPSKTQLIEAWNKQSIDASASFVSDPWDLNLRHPADPPRPPKPGMEWVWFPQGYWAERELPVAPSTSLGSSPLGPASSSPGPPSSKHSSRQKWWNRTPEAKTPSAVATDKASQSQATPPTKITTPNLELPYIRIGSSSRKASIVEAERRRSSSHKSTRSLQLGGFSFISKSKPNDSPFREDPPLGLYCRTKKGIREILYEGSRRAITNNSKLGPPASERSLKSQTTILLEATAEVLDEKEREKERERVRGVTTPRSIKSVVSLDGRLRRSFGKGFGLAPWHRRSSHESFLSVTSSIRRLLMGTPPVPTPNSEGKYKDNNGELFDRVDISSMDPRQPTCLPSEARRINTPPMETGSPTMMPRGFFFDLASAQSTETTSETGGSRYSGGSGSKKGKSRNSGGSGSKVGGRSQHSGGSGSVHARSLTNRSRPGSPGPTQWWETDTKHAATGNKSTDKLKSTNKPPHMELPAGFVLDVPDHLPNSPLCPKHSMHKSGGKGICPMHGRRRSVKLKQLRRVDTGESGIAPSEISKKS